MDEQLTEQELLLVQRFRQLDGAAQSYVAHFLRGLLDDDIQNKKSRPAVQRIGD